jgi:mRNA interferase MazF
VAKPSRGEVWFTDFGDPIGHEQGWRRPCLIVSVDGLNHGPAGLAIVLPITSVEKGIPYHVEVNPPEGGLKARSFIKCEDVRSISTDRLIKPFGTVTPATLSEVGYRLRVLLNL